MRPATERYVRSVVESNGIELVLGIAYSDAAEYFTLLSISKQLLRDAVNSLSGSHAVTNPALLAEAVEAEVVKQWPGRLFFLEVCSASERDGWVQVYSGQASKLEQRIDTLAKQRCVGCLAEAQYRAKEDDRLEQRIKALESAPTDTFGTEEDWAKLFERINKHDNTSRGMPMPSLKGDDE